MPCWNAHALPRSHVTPEGPAQHLARAGVEQVPGTDQVQRRVGRAEGADVQHPRQAPVGDETGAFTASAETGSCPACMAMTAGFPAPVVSRNGNTWSAIVPIVPMSPHVARLRAAVGHELLLLPSTAVLPVGDDGTVLLVQQAGSNDWSTLGGAVEIGESPAESAIRESYEELGVDVELTRLLGVDGGPDYEVTYPNGDKVAYVVSAYEGRITGGSPHVNDGELGSYGWFAQTELARLPLTRLTRALLTATELMPGEAAQGCG